MICIEWVQHHLALIKISKINSTQIDELTFTNKVKKIKPDSFLVTDRPLFCENNLS